MKEHADRLIEIFHVLESQNLSYRDSASPYFDGVINSGNNRIPFVVSKNFKYFIKDNKYLYKYHYSEYNFLIFDYLQDSEYKIYYHDPFIKNGLKEITLNEVCRLLNK